jgi:hypothetical protein
MTAFWSATDTETIESLGHDWTICIVTNKNKEYKIRLDIFQPFKAYVDDVPIEEEDEDLSDLEALLQEEIIEKVEEKTWRRPEGYDNYGNNNRFPLIAGREDDDNDSYLDPQRQYSKKKYTRLRCQNLSCDYSFIITKKKLKKNERRKCPECQSRMIDCESAGFDNYDDGYSEVDNQVGA